MATGLRVAIVQESMPHYRVPFFNELRSTLSQDGITLDVFYGKPSKLNRRKSDQEELPWGVQLKAYRIGPMVWHRALCLLRSYDLIIVEHANRHLLNYLLLAARVFTKSRYKIAFWGHGGNLQKDPKAALERFKRWTLRRPDWWFAYTRGSSSRVIGAGFPADRVTIVQNSALVEGTGHRADREIKTAVYVGGLYSDKRIRFLLDSADLAFMLDPDFRLIILGDGPDRDLIFSKNRREYLTYLGFAAGAAKVEVLAQASILMMPGLIGLVVIDSFACEAPIVTVDSNRHSPEYEYLISGENSIILDPSCSELEFAKTVVDVLQNRLLLEKLEAGCRQAAERYTLDAMVYNYAGGISRALRSFRR